MREQRRQQALRRGSAACGQRLEGQHDQRVAGQHRDALAEGACTEGTPRRVAASSKQGRSSCTSEAQCSSSMAAGGGVGQRRVVVAAGAGHRQAQLRPDARAAGEHRMADRRGQQRRAPRALAQRQRALQRLLDALRRATRPGLGDARLRLGSGGDACVTFCMSLLVVKFD